MRWIVIVYCFVWFFCLPARAETTLDWNLGTLYQYQWQSFEKDRAGNPDNQILRFPDRTQLVELQPNFNLQSENLELDLQPRLTQLNDYSDRYGQSDSDASLRYWYLSYRLLSDYHLKVGRYVNLWGPARLVSPSNRYHLNTGQANPNIELLARDFVEVGGDINSQWRFLVIANYAKGEQKINDFDATGDAQLAWNAGDLSVTGVVSKLESGTGVGGFGQWTASDATIVYTDLFYRSAAFNQEDLLRFDSPVLKRKLFSIISGVSYTFESGLNLAVDYLFNQGGLAATEEQDILAQSNQYVEELLLGDVNRQKLSYVTRVNRLPFYQMGKRYFFGFLQKNDVFGDTNINYLAIYNVIDHSMQHSLTVDYHKYDSINIYLGFSDFKGHQNSEFGRFLSGQFSLGLRYTF